jgi:hypothetical protein
MGGACSTHGKGQSENLTGRDYKGWEDTIKMHLNMTGYEEVDWI